MRYRWNLIARPSQLPPIGDWLTWLFMAGRGAGKTRAGAEWSRDRARAAIGRGALIGPTAADVRDVMIEGESGILACSPPSFRPVYEPSKRRLTWPNGTMATCFSAEEPERLRGPQFAWCWSDEVGAWKAPESWDMMMFGLRLGPLPQVVATTTPKPRKLIRSIMSDPNTVITRGTTHDNAANLAPSFIANIESRYGGTALGRQEIGGEYLDEIPGAFWHRNMFDERTPAPDCTRVVVGVDPAVTSGEDSDETGIVAAGKGIDARFYVLADRSCRLPPDAWARRVVATYDATHADVVVAEANNGGDLVRTVLRTVRPTLPVVLVHASRGKQTRAQPISALYEQKRVTHVEEFAALEDQLCEWTPEAGNSPDRLDALVWALTELSQSSEWGAV